jgi:hypothetical protein
MKFRSITSLPGKSIAVNLPLARKHVDIVQEFKDGGVSGAKGSAIVIGRVPAISGRVFVTPP